jgi:hypothetical protein
MIRRRAALVIVALVLTTADGIFAKVLYNHRAAKDAYITHIGLDSLEMIIPMGARAARLHNGIWDIDPMKAMKSVPIDQARGIDGKSLALVSLAPRSTYGQAINVIRNLKARRICNVLIRESGRAEGGSFNFPGGVDRALAVPAIVLCGSSIGDAGFYGDLPADGRIQPGELR